MKYRLPLLGIGLAVAALAVWHPASRTSLTVDSTPNSTPESLPHHTRRDTVSTVAVVYVVGAVRRPGLYRIAQQARADDAVRAAGGLRTDADPAGVNLAAYVRDGDEVLVPLLGQSTSRVVKRRTLSPRVRKSGTPHVVDVNLANTTELATVPGIGATIAARIVAVRERDGTYTSLDELLDVAGMTQSRLDRASPYLHI